MMWSDTDERRSPSLCRRCHRPPAAQKSRQRRICQPDHRQRRR
ncbi:hypothetical protein [Escherichia coli]